MSMHIEVRDQRHHLNAIGRPQKGTTSNASSASASGRERMNMPILPHLRALLQESPDAPASEESIPLSASPRSGPVRVHPYRKVDEPSSFELVPSPAIRAPRAQALMRVSIRHQSPGRAHPQASYQNQYRLRAQTWQCFLGHTSAKG